MPANLENSAVATGLEKSVFITVTKKGNAKECSNYCILALISHATKVMLKILQARLQQHMNQELPDVQAGFRKGRGTRDQIANILWIIKKTRECQKNITSVLLTMPKPWLCSVHCSSVTQLCLTLCDQRDCSMPGFPVHHQLAEHAQNHVHQVGELPTISTSSVVPFSSCLQSFPASGSLPMTQFFTSGGQRLEFQLQHQSFQWIFRTDFF